MAAMLDFQVANRVNFISIPMGLTVPNLVLVSQFARFFSYPLHYKKLQKTECLRREGYISPLCNAYPPKPLQLPRGACGVLWAT